MNPTRRALLETRRGPELVEVQVTGRQREMGASSGLFTLVEVHVPGEARSRWIAEERLEPADATEREAWLASLYQIDGVEELRPTVEA